jgi:hypothetical protein
MIVRSKHALLATIPMLLSCGDSQTPDGEPAGAAVPIAGLYEVTGVTVSTDTGQERQIAGTVILALEGDQYTATFQLNTTYPGPEAEIPAEVIGKGEGSIEGRTLTGTAATQLVMSTVPGIDPAFAFIPRVVTTRIVSASTTSIQDDGTMVIKITNQPAQGVEYSPTVTTLRGRRISAAGIGGGIDSTEGVTEQ